VNKVKNNTFTLNIVSYTWENTNLYLLKKGERINVEVDMLARYVTQNLK
jgi:riboflavin synthase